MFGAQCAAVISIIREEGDLPRETGQVDRSWKSDSVLSSRFKVQKDIKDLA